ncbi:MAG: carboxypeptidase regulatory-like domain-containing protein [Candidatus Thermoplasmatota archaeon]|nr:carboxypeptidase regulatory-like domain-containing protein [Candidatus Thermoplasmatota archaeon]
MDVYRTGGFFLKRRTIEAPCPGCGTPVILRLPDGADEGSFSVECQDCDELIDLDIKRTPDGGERILMNGRVLERSPPEDAPERMTGRKKASAKPEIIKDGATWGADYSRRMVVAFWILVIVGILGLASSVTTVTNSFTIKDLEEQSPNDTVTFSVWVFDSDTGRPIPGASIAITDGSYYANGTSDSEGLIVLDNVRTGQFQMFIHHHDYKTTKGDIFISKGTPNVLDVPMEIGNPSQTAEAPLVPIGSRTYSPGLTNIMALLMFMSSVSAFISAFFVRMREFFTLAVISAFLSIFSFGFLLGSILSLAAIIIVINSYRGFYHNYELRMLLEEKGREDIRNLFTNRDQIPPRLPPAR